MKDKKIIFSIISIIVICIIKLGFKINEDIKYKSKPKITILSAMDNIRNEEIKKMLNKNFPNYNIIINESSDIIAENIVKTELNNGSNDIVLGIEKNKLEEIIEYMEKEELDFISKYKYSNENEKKYYMTMNKSEIAIVINKKYNSLDKISYEYLLKISENNKLTLPNLKNIYESQNFCLGLKEKIGEEEAIKYLEKINKNILKYPTNNDGMINLLKKKEMEIGLLPYYLAYREFSNSNIYDIRELEKNSYVEETIFLISNKEENKEVLEVLDFIINKYIEIENKKIIKNKNDIKKIKEFKDRNIYYKNINLNK